MSISALDTLSTRAFPELAQAVRAVVSQTIEAWESAVRETLVTAHPLTMEQLRDDLPQILEGVASALESDQRPATDALAAISPLHGDVRYHQGFKLDEVLIEYSILRSILIVNVGRRLGRAIDCAEFLAIGAAMDVTVQRAVVRFVEHLSRQLQASSEAQSKYLSFLSHDLRGGLNGVFLMIEVIKRGLINEPRLNETVDDLDMLRRSLLETVGTMDRFLHAERFRKGKVQVRPTKLNLRNVLNEIYAYFSYQAKEKGIALSVEAPADVAIVSDKELLTMIFQNLVSNALKYTKANSKVSIAGRANGETFIVAVSDQGPGIAADKLNELFVPFARGETYGQPGMGLGLTIARQAAMYLNAKLWAESKPGEGSTFFVELPKEIAPTAPAPAAASAPK